MERRGIRVKLEKEGLSGPKECQHKLKEIIFLGLIVHFHFSSGLEGPEGPKVKTISIIIVGFIWKYIIARIILGL